MTQDTAPPGTLAGAPESELGATRTVAEPSPAPFAPPPRPLGQRRDKSQPTPGGYYWGTGRRKAAVARVRIRPGAGEIMINKRAADHYFVREVDRQTIRTPMQLTETTKTVDVFVNLAGGGTTGQAGAVAPGVARALVRFDSRHEQTLRDNGFLTRDARQVERKKYGRAGARKRFQFSKR